MKALVIENQYQQDAQIDGLIKDHPNLFEEVEVITGSLHRQPEELIKEVKKCDALIISSTFLYKDQLEDITKLLAEIDSKKVYVRRLSDKIKEWKEKDGLHFYDYDLFIQSLKTCIEKHEVFSFEEEWEDRTTKDEVWERMKYADSTGRGKFNIKSISKL